MQFSSIHTMVVKTAGRLALLSICSIMPAVYADTLDAVRKVAGESVEVATVAAVNAGEVAASVPSERGAEEVSDEASASPPEEKIIPWAWGNKWLQGTINRAGGDNEFDPADGIDWGYVPNPVYSSEKKLGLGLVVFGLFVADEESLNVEDVKLSKIVFKGFGTTNGSKGFETNLRSFFKADTYRLNVDLEFADTPEVFYGLGIEPSQDEVNELIYNHQGQNFQARGLKRVFGDTFLGLGVRYHDNEAEDFRGANIGAATVLTDSTSVGITGHWLHDSRDHQDNPSKGWLLQFDYATFNESFGSDTDFDQLEFRYSGYRPIDTFLNQRTATLAWQVQGHLSEGNVPWDRLTLLGGSRQLRGYEQGRYRGHQKVLAQIELRQPLPGRHGVVTWAGVGTLSEDISDLGEERWLPSVGVGYRLRIKEKINLRFDVGFGRSDKGVYVSVNEVF
jgi:hypothetical protein